MQVLSPHLRIGVLRGGPSPEYDVSLKSGGKVLEILSETHRPLDIFISRDGVWHMNGLPRKPERVLSHVDVVFNALHGAYGEDGKVQQILDYHAIPFTGAGTLASAMGMNKIFSKELFKKYGIKTPDYEIIEANKSIKEKIENVCDKFVMPVVVKPSTAGSSVGVVIAYTFLEIMEAVLKAFRYSDTVLIEEYIKGKEATCGVIEDFRGEDLYALLPVEIRPKVSSFFDYQSKYDNNATEEICPGRFFEDEKSMIEKYAKEAHKALGLRHYSRSDFIVTSRGKVYILETNTLPGMTENSLLPKSLKAVGVPLKDFIHHILKLALNKK